MRTSWRLAIVLVVAIGLAAIATSFLVEATTRSWFDKDLELRAQLAIGGSRRALVERWQAGSPALAALLADVAHDERIMGVLACDAALMPLATTPDVPPAVTCSSIGWRVRASVQSPAAEWRGWRGSIALPGGRVAVNAVPLLDGDRALGFVALVHDLSFIERRESTTRRFLLWAFLLVATLTGVVMLAAVRLSWRDWSNDLRRLLRGGHQRPEFQPILRDVRDLVQRLTAEQQASSGAWTPARLKQTLARYVHGERILLVANREPYVHERNAAGEVTVLHPASGLVTALEPVMRACSGVWVAHGSGSADRETADPAGRVAVPPGEESYVLRRVWLGAEEERGYYYGFSNEGLWPLCHIADARPIFRTRDWELYREVNERFADAVCEEADGQDPIVLVQDYHFALLPRLIRERLPRATVIMFWHIPWPNSERFGICPMRESLLEGMLGASILGFHTQFHCNNFLDSVDRFLETRIDREHDAVVRNGRSTLVRPYPISVEWPSRWTRGLAPAGECRATVRRELGLPDDTLLGVGIDRLDYTKGIEQRLLAVERLLERRPEFRGRFTFAQLAAPSRTGIDRYRELGESVVTIAGRINERFGTPGYRPVALLRAHHEPPTVFRYYRAADVVYVSSLHDGMNLVAKEFVSARDDERGVLVLSEFTGAARELTEALIVNPYDLDQASEALATALTMSPEEQRTRMRAMRAFVAEFNVYRWAGRMLEDAARRRIRDRLSGRLSDSPAALGGAE